MTIHVKLEEVLKETPLVENPNYFGFTRDEIENLKGKSHLNFNTKFQVAVIRKLDTLPSSELEEFIEFNLNLVHNKLDWLRDLNTMINVNRTDPERDLKGNALILDKLIPKIIAKYKSPKQSKSDEKLGLVSFVDIEENLILKTQFTIAELLLLFDVLNMANLIDTDPWTKEKLASFISMHFTTLNKDTLNKPGSVRQIMKSSKDSAYFTLGDKLFKVNKYLKILSESEN